MTTTKPTTKEAFKAVVSDLQDHYGKPAAFGVGIGTADKSGNLLEVFYPFPNFQENYGTAAVLAHVLGWNGVSGFSTISPEQLKDILSYFAPFRDDGETHGNIDALDAMARATSFGSVEGGHIVAAFIDVPESSPVTVADAYLRLHLLSHRKVLPHEINVKPGELMPILPNVAWTSNGPILASEANEALLEARIYGSTVRVYGVDKLPHMLDYVVPSGVRIADSARVRLGAYVGDGTTVMPSGFMNFNSATRGKAMIEGRVSQGVIVGDGSDLGGGASTQGVMSGGSNIVVSIGDRTLIGALAGTGISLGHDCIVAAGVYIMPSNDIAVFSKDYEYLGSKKVHEFSGQDGLLFKEGRDGLEVHPNKKVVELNPDLHAN